MQKNTDKFSGLQNMGKGSHVSSSGFTDHLSSCTCTYTYISKLRKFAVIIFFNLTSHDVSAHSPSTTDAHSSPDSGSAVADESALKDPAIQWATGRPVPCKMCKSSPHLYTKRSLQTHLTKKHKMRLNTYHNRSLH